MTVLFDRGSKRVLPSDTAIEAFWSWFEEIAERLAIDFDNAALLEELDARVWRLGELAWELGPGASAENALTITPDGDRGWLAASQRVVVMAPELPTWEFHAAKPPKQWDLQFSIERSDGEVLELDARGWRYVLLRMPDGRYDIVLEQNNLRDHVGDDDRWAAALVLLDGLLGEAKRLLLIGDIETVRELPREQALNASSVAVLSSHLESLE